MKSHQPTSNQASYVLMLHPCHFPFEIHCFVGRVTYLIKFYLFIVSSFGLNSDTTAFPWNQCILDKALVQLV